MYESPYFGYIVPLEWQEPDDGDNFDDSEPEIDDELDAEGYLITAN